MTYKLDKNYDSLGRLEKWDTETQRIIKQRIANELGDVLSYEFLTPREGEILEILVDTFIPQDRNGKYVKVSEIIDRDLKKEVKGVRYGENPWPREFYRRGLAETEVFVKKTYGKPLEDFSSSQTENMLGKIFDFEPGNFLRRFLKKVLADATAIYYSHPASWNSIGFPGPAYPDGYPYLDCREKEDWEPRYAKKSAKN